MASKGGVVGAAWTWASDMLRLEAGAEARGGVSFWIAAIKPGSMPSGPPTGEAHNSESRGTAYAE